MVTHVDDDDDEYTYEDWREYEAERKAKRGTAECDNLCDPTCDWCLVGHACPEQCGGGAECPYVALAARERSA